MPLSRNRSVLLPNASVPVVTGVVTNGVQPPATFAIATTRPQRITAQTKRMRPGVEIKETSKSRRFQPSSTVFEAFGFTAIVGKKLTSANVQAKGIRRGAGIPRHPHQTPLTTMMALTSRAGAQRNAHA